MMMHVLVCRVQLVWRLSSCSHDLTADGIPARIELAVAAVCACISAQCMCRFVALKADKYCSWAVSPAQMGSLQV